MTDKECSCDLRSRLIREWIPFATPSTLQHYRNEATVHPITQVALPVASARHKNQTRSESPAPSPLPQMAVSSPAKSSADAKGPARSHIEPSPVISEAQSCPHSHHHLCIPAYSSPRRPKQVWFQWGSLVAFRASSALVLLRRLLCSACSKPSRHLNHQNHHRPKTRSNDASETKPNVATRRHHQTQTKRTTKSPRLHAATSASQLKTFCRKLPLSLVAPHPTLQAFRPCPQLSSRQATQKTVEITPKPATRATRVSEEKGATQKTVDITPKPTTRDLRRLPTSI